MDEDRSQSAIWRTLAELTRENGQQDKHIAELQGGIASAIKAGEKVDAVVTDLRRVESKMDVLDEAGSEALRKLRDIIQRRGYFDGFTEDEFRALREVIKVHATAEHTTLLADVKDLLGRAFTPEERAEARAVMAGWTTFADDGGALEQLNTILKARAESRADAQSWRLWWRQQKRMVVVTITVLTPISAIFGASAYIIAHHVGWLG